MSEADPGAAGLMERVDRLLLRLHYRIARSVEAREDIFRLRYAAYLREGSIAASESRMLSDSFEDTPGTQLVGIFLDGRLVASIRLHVLTKTQRTSPAHSIFPDLIDPLLEQGNIIVDPSRFVIDHEASRMNPELPYAVLRMPFIAGGYFDADIVTATCRPEHETFYARVLRCKRVSPPRPYPMLSKTSGLMMVQYVSEAPKVISRYPFFAARGEEMMFANSQSQMTAEPSATACPDLSAMSFSR